MTVHTLFNKTYLLGNCVCICGRGYYADHTKCNIVDKVLLRCIECGNTILDEKVPEYFDFDVVDCLCPNCCDEND